MGILTVVGVSGPPAIGTSKAVDLATQRLPNAKSVKFGDFLRQIAGNDNLQDFGERYYEQYGPRGMVKQLLRTIDDQDWNTLIIDGIRHVSIWNEIQQQYPNSRLLYAGAPPEIVTKIITRKYQTSGESARKIASHRIETEFDGELRSRANQKITLNELKSIPEKIAAAVITQAVAAPIVVTTEMPRVRGQFSGTRMQYGEIGAALDSVANFDSRLEASARKMDLSTPVGRAAYVKMVSSLGEL